MYSDAYGNALFLSTIVLGLIYNALIIFKTPILDSKYKFLSAGFVGVFSCFIVFNGGVIQLLYLKDFDYISANAFAPYMDYASLMKFNAVTALGNVCFWLGYMLPAGRKLFAFYYEGIGYKRFLHLDIGALFPKVFIVIGLGLNFILFINGAFGRGLSTPEDFDGIVRYLVLYSSYVEKISMVGYFLLALLYFKDGSHKVWFWATLLIQVVFALVSGARGPIIFLFLLTMIPYYYVNRKITKQIIIAGAFTLFVAFTIASEIKVFTQSFNSNSVSISDYAESFMEFREKSQADIDRRIYRSVYYSLMRRLSSVAQGSVAIKYKDQHGVDEYDPKFIGELVTAPLYVVIPRTQLGGQFPNWGQWYRLKVLRQNNDSYLNNISFGQVGYFYLAGKWLFVAIGFIIYGIILRFANNFLELNSGLSFLVYVAIISVIGYVAASIPSSSVTFLRYIIFLPIIFYVTIKVSNRLRI